MDKDEIKALYIELSKYWHINKGQAFCSADYTAQCAKAFDLALDHIMSQILEMPDE
jgi:hypothetical protein